MFIRYFVRLQKQVLRNRQPIAFAVLRLTKSSKFVGCSTGRFPWLRALENLVDVGGGADRNCCVMFTL